MSKVHFLHDDIVQIVCTKSKEAIRIHNILHELAINHVYIRLSIFMEAERYDIIKKLIEQP